jgi:hypothetical protein
LLRAVSDDTQANQLCNVSIGGRIERATECSF